MDDCKYKNDYSKCPNIVNNPKKYLDKNNKCICHRLDYLGFDEHICDTLCFDGEENNDKKED